jgi:hypothetical protein
MTIVLVVVGLAALAAVIVLFVLNPKFEARRDRARVATTDAAAGSSVLLRDDAAQCLGIERGDEKPAHYGDGSAALTSTALIYTATMSGETTVVARTAIREVVVDSAHIIKSAQMPVLKLVWDDGDADASGRWKLADLDAWVEALGGTTEPGPVVDDEG